MPFALTILKEKHHKYIQNKNLFDFMTIGSIQKRYYNNIINGTHPYDKTVRPSNFTKKL